MAHENDPILIYTTFETPDHAREVGRALVSARLAACVNIIPVMTSIYEWEGTLQEAAETVMVIKSRAGLRERLLEEAKRLHPYEIPALLVLEPAGYHPDFVAWICAQTVTRG